MIYDMWNNRKGRFILVESLGLRMEVNKKSSWEQNPGLKRELNSMHTAEGTWDSALYVFCQQQLFQSLLFSKEESLFILFFIYVLFASLFAILFLHHHISIINKLLIYESLDQEEANPNLRVREAGIDSYLRMVWSLDQPGTA